MPSVTILGGGNTAFAAAANRTLRGLIDIGPVVMGLDGWNDGRGVDDLGIAGMSRESLRGHLQTGKPC